MPRGPNRTTTRPGDVNLNQSFLHFIGQHFPRTWPVMAASARFVRIWFVMVRFRPISTKFDSFGELDQFWSEIGQLGPISMNIRSVSTICVGDFGRARSNLGRLRKTSGEVDQFWCEVGQQRPVLRVGFVGLRDSPVEICLAGSQSRSCPVKSLVGAAMLRGNPNPILRDISHPLPPGISGRLHSSPPDGCNLVQP